MHSKSGTDFWKVRTSTDTGLFLFLNVNIYKCKYI